MAKLFSAAALTFALASFGCRAAPSNCGACCPSGGAVASQPTYASDETATAQAEPQRRYSYSPNGSAQAAGTANGSRQAQSAYNARQWRADRKVVGF